jgi:phage FluMu gp28-like protein
MPHSRTRAQTPAQDQLRSLVAESLAAARSLPPWALDLVDLRGRSAAHPSGAILGGWLNPYPVSDPRHCLLPYQFVNFHDLSRFKICLQARQTGKDFILQAEAVEDCFLRPGTRWLIAAPSERQSLASLELGKVWARAFGLVIDDFQVTREGGAGTLLRAAEIRFANGSVISAVPGRPDTVRGASANLGLTEFDFFEQPSETWRALVPSITNPLRGGEKKVRIVTTPNGKDGAAFRLWHKPPTAALAWSRHRVTIHHAVLMGLPLDVAQLREVLDDPEGFAQEYECDFVDRHNVLLPYDLIAAAESADASESADPALWAPAVGTDQRLYLGIDFGRTTDPTVCWTLERVGDVLWTREVLVLRDTPTPDQEKILLRRIHRATLVCFDRTGAGVGLADYLVRPGSGLSEWKPAEHKFGQLQLCTFTPEFKRQIFPKLRRAFEAPVKLRIPVSASVREDLHAMQQVVTNGQFNYWAPRSREGHSDRCTALALAVEAAGSTRGTGAFKPIAIPGREHVAWEGRRMPL